jgi:hypothetical protein
MSLSARTTADQRQGVWSKRTVLDLHQERARSDLLFTMSDNTRTFRQSRTNANPYSLLDEHSAWLTSTHAKKRSGWRRTSAPRRQTPAILSADTKIAPLTRQSGTANLGPPIWDRQSGTANLVEPDGIEPTTSCLQSRRSPN